MTTRFAFADYVLRDSTNGGRCDGSSPRPEEDMTRSTGKTFLEKASRNEQLLTGAGTRDEPRSCLVCGARIGSGDRTMQIRGAVVHLSCAAYRRRKVHR